VGQPTETSSANRIVCALADWLSVPYLVPFVLLALAIGTLLGNCLSGTERLAFRDVGHFYTPLYGYVAARERAQWLPLYNDLDHTGIPLAGETTTALFYPVRRLVFRLIDSPETAIAWYVALHLILAGITAAWAALKSGASRYGASLAMLAYPLSGPIWFLYTNPPFLVGAAWLPLALGGGFALLRAFRFRDLTATSFALALMILGGDPQTAVHVVLIGAMVWSVKTLAAMLGSRRSSIAISIRSSSSSILRLTAALILAILLAAPQIAASIDWAPQSMRYADNDPATLHEIFAFSVAPWHWAELLVASISGTLFPRYTRISHLLPGDGRTWAITLYCGLIPLSLALLRYRYFLRLRAIPNAGPVSKSPLASIRIHSDRFDGWDLLAPLGLVLAMGNLSIGAFLRWTQPQWLVGIDDLWLSPYAWLVAWLPGYSGFRYPAKWLVFVPLGITIAAARQVGQLTRPNIVAASRIAIRLAIVGFLIAASVMIFLNIRLLQSPEMLNRSDSIWGPLDYQAAQWVVAASTIALICFAKLFHTISRLSISGYKIFCGLLLLTAIDLWIVARASLATVNRKNEAGLIASVGKHWVGFDQPDSTRVRTMRAMRVSSRGWPSALRQTPSDGDQRILISEASMRNSLFGRWHLDHNIAVFNSPTSLPPGRMRSFWIAANKTSRKLADDQQKRYWNRLFQWLAIDQTWMVTDTVGRLPRDVSESPITSLIPTRITSPSPLVAWHKRWNEIAVTDTVSATDFDQRLRAIVSDTAEADIPWVESLADTPITSNLINHTASEDASLLSISQPVAGHWRILIESPVAGLITIKQYQDGNARAIVRVVKEDGTSNVRLNTRRNASRADADRLVEREVYRCDYLFSAVMVPAGRIELQVIYTPQWKSPTLVITGLCWAILIAGNLPFGRLLRRQGESRQRDHYTIGISAHNDCISGTVAQLAHSSIALSSDVPNQNREKNI